MSGPLTRAVKGYIDKGTVRFHMPGHKGRAPDGPDWGSLWAWDVTECEGLDSLYWADGPIRETEREYSRIYGTADSLISAGGSTLCIQAMLAMALSPGDKLLIGREAHGAALGAMALLDLHPAWMLPPIDTETGLPVAVTAAQVEASLAVNPGVRAVYITSPSYFGAIADIAAIADICRSYGAALLVDNAHGAHLAFTPQKLHPAFTGADICCDSLHKTLPVLTGGAMLHIINDKYPPAARRAMALFGSTSPSYPIMLSIDGALGYLREDILTDSPRVSSAVAELAAAAVRKGLRVLNPPLSDPWRLTLCGADIGCDGAALGKHLRGCGIEPELALDKACVLMASGKNTAEDFERLAGAIDAIQPGEAASVIQARAITLPKRAVSLREAVFAPREPLPVESATGRVAATTVCPCPPGTPLIAAGEYIDEDIAKTLKSYGVFIINVLK